jgi:HK97 family phage portal protein
MSIFGGLFGGPAAAGGTGWFGIPMGARTDSGVSVSEFNAVKLPAVYACVGLISDAIAQLPIRIYRRRGDAREEIADHPLVELLNRRPNPRMTAFTLRKTSLHHTLLWGNGYTEIQRRGDGRPAGLWLALPDRTYPQLLPTGMIEYITSIRRPGRPDEESVRLDPADVLHIPALGFDGVVGYSPVAVARQAIGLGMAMEEFGAKFFGNDAKSGGYLKYPGRLSPEAVNRLRESWQAQSGIDQAHRPKVLEEGMEFQQTTITPEDAQFLESRDFQVAEIARIYRVPLHMIQSVSGTTSWGSGLAEMSLGFVRFTLDPWMVPIEQEMGNKLLTEQERAQGFYLKHDTTDLLRGDIAARASYYTAALNPQTGWLTRAEVRTAEDRNPLNDDDAARFGGEGLI